MFHQDFSCSDETRLIGNGQAPVHKYWKGLLKDYIMTGKFDPTMCVKISILILKIVLRFCKDIDSPGPFGGHAETISCIRFSTSGC